MVKQMQMSDANKDKMKEEIEGGNDVLAIICIKNNIIIMAQCCIIIIIYDMVWCNNNNNNNNIIPGILDNKKLKRFWL